MEDLFGPRTTEFYQICLAEILNRSAKARGTKVRDYILRLRELFATHKDPGSAPSSNTSGSVAALWQARHELIVVEKSALSAELETTKQRLKDATTQLRASQACKPQASVSISPQLTRPRQPPQQQAGKRKRQASQVPDVVSAGDAVKVTGSGRGRPQKKTKRESAFEKEVIDALKTLRVPAYGVPAVQMAADKFLERLRRLAGLMQRRDNELENAAKELCCIVPSLTVLVRLEGTRGPRGGLTQRHPGADSHLALHRSVMVLLRFYAMLCASGEEAASLQGGVATTMGHAVAAVSSTTTTTTPTIIITTMTGAVLNLFRELLSTLQESSIVAEAVEQQATNPSAHLLHTFLVTLAALGAASGPTGAGQAALTTRVPAALHVSILHAVLQRLGALTHTSVYGHGVPPESLCAFLSTPLPERATETEALRTSRARADAEARLLMPALRLALAAVAAATATGPSGSVPRRDGLLEVEMDTVRRTLWKGVFGDLLGAGPGEGLLQPPAYVAPVEAEEGEGANAEGEQWLVARMWELFGWEDVLGVK